MSKRQEKREIHIYQDFNGSFGLYLFRAGNYFALSNSFIVLVDYVKKKYPLSVNKNYCNYLLMADLCSAAYSETPANEIQILPKNAVVSIAIDSAYLDIKLLDYYENSIELNSAAGIARLDSWFRNWTNCIRCIYEQGGKITADLSGGFDSRLVFALLLHSGIPMQDTLIKSATDGLHTHSEDYKIASQIAESCNFSLNHVPWAASGCCNCSMDEILGISFATKLGFHKQMYFKYYYNRETIFTLTGGGGECIRKYWDMTPQQYLEKQLNRCKDFGYIVRRELECSIKIILAAAFDAVGQKFNIPDRRSKDLTRNLYRETRCRTHFGKQAVEAYLSNNIQLQPLLDPELHMLKLSDGNCSDSDLLIAMIFTRYAPELLSFQFEGGRSIKSQTISYAKKICELYPIETAVCKSKCITRTINNSYDVKSEGYRITSSEVDQYLRSIFMKKMFRKNFESYFDEEIYRTVEEDMKKRKYYPLSNAYPVFAICKMINDANTSKSLKCNSGADYFMGWTEFPTCQADDMRELLSIAREIMYARIDVKNLGSVGNDLLIQAISDNTAKISTPAWFGNNGKGYVVQCYKGYVEITVKCICEGELIVKLLGQDIRDQNGVRIPKWIDYTELKINGKNVFKGVKAAWHDQPYLYSCQCKDGDVFLIQAWWRPSH